MNHNEKLQWMATWAAMNNLKLELQGECGLGRECVGVIANGLYPEYEWYSDKWNRIDSNGEVWTPPEAYHKHPCVAVLGRGEAAEATLYTWLRWFDENGFKLEIGDLPMDQDLGVIGLILRKDKYARLVRKG